MDSIRAEVVFESPTVFGGDDVRAVVTFRNVSKPSGAPAAPAAPPTTRTRSASEPRQSIDQGWRDRWLGGLLGGSNGDYVVIEEEGEQQEAVGHKAAEPKRRGLGRSRSVRRKPVPPFGSRETLVMGTVRIEGHFVVDPDTVDVSRLEHIRNRGAAMGLSSHNTGLLPAEEEDGEEPKPGLTRRLLWGIDSLLGVNEVASEEPSEDGVPIYSSAQSLLFADLTLNPGESKSYYYKCTLPRQLPPSYRGKAVRIYYSLVVSTQRGGSVAFVPAPSATESSENGSSAPGGGGPAAGNGAAGGVSGGSGPAFGSTGRAMTSPPKRLNAPFRVFQYVDDDGDCIPHLIDNPIAGEESAVVVKELNDSSKSTMHDVFREALAPTAAKASTVTHHELLQHVSRLREAGISSATPEDDEYEDHATSAAAHIARLIQSNGMISKTMVPKTTFHISRNSKYIGTLSLSKPLYRIGDSMVLSFDFSGSTTPCYHVTASLETTETIHRSFLPGYEGDDGLALGQGGGAGSGSGSNTPQSTSSADIGGRRLSGSRDPNMINLASTRRIYAQEMTFIYGVRDRVTFDMVVPATAASQFNTTKISMSWSLKLTFVTHFADKLTALIHKNEIKRQERAGEGDLRVITNVPKPLVSEPNSPVSHTHKRTSSLGNGSGNENVLSVQDSAVIAPVEYDSRGTTYGPKDSFSCEHFSCKIPLNVYSTDKDISSVIGVSRGNSVYSLGLW